MRFRIFAFVVCIVALLGLASCAGKTQLEITGSPATHNGVTVTLDEATAERKSNPDRYEYSFSGTIENTTDEPIMQVIYTFALLDASGEEFRSFGEVYDGETQAIPPHSSIPFSHEGIKWGAQSVPATVEIGVSTVQTEAELPAAHVPQAGEYLYKALDDEKLANIKTEAPAQLEFHVDQGGYGRTATFEQGDTLTHAVDLFCNIKIAGEADEWVTDNYNWIQLTWEDGSTSFISLNLQNLEYSVHSRPHVYALDSLDEFWTFAASYLEEDA